MNKAMFQRLKIALKKRWSHISKSKRFVKIADNPAGTKMINRCRPDSNRGADGTIRR